MTLKVNNMYSGYRQIPVLKNINFTLAEGDIVGLIGLNGAGKSTLLKTILGLLHPQQGEITIDGQTIAEDHASYASKLAYIPETPILYEHLTLREHLQMTGLGYGIDPETIEERARPLLKRFRLEKELDWLPIHFSKGMKQKVMIISAFITDAEILIIDEPFLGLDPLAIRDFTDMIKEKAAQGVSILFTTHMLSMADDLCDKYLLLSEGELIGQGTLEELRQTFHQPDADLTDIYLMMTELAVSEEKERIQHEDAQ